MSQCGIGIYVENGIDILSLFYASFVENDGNEMHTRTTEEMCT
jgi:hypothetical protein